MHYLLFYEVVERYAERRQAFRTAPLDGAVLLFRGASPAAAEAFAASDPYVMNGLVTRWHVREWTTVVGVDAAVPLPDATA